MKRSIIAAISGLMLLGASAPAYANDPYVGLGIGGFNINTGVSKKMTSGAFLQVGDDFSEYLGGEVRLGSSGRTGEEFTLQPRTRVDWFAAAFLKPKYDFNDKVRGYALLGVATVRGSYSAPGVLKQAKTRTGLGYGLGVEYRFDNALSLGGEWSHLLSKPNNTAATINTSFQGVSSSIFTATVKYHFF